MKTTQQHLDALLAAEGNSSELIGITSTVEAFQKKQQVASQTKSSIFQWITTTRELQTLEQTLTVQIERMQNELGLSSSPLSDEEQQMDNLLSLQQDLEEDIREQRQRTMQLVFDQRNHCDIPPTLSKALESLHTQDGEVEMLKEELISKFDAIKHEHDKTIQDARSIRVKNAARETLQRKRDEIEKEGLKEVECLRKRMIERSNISANRAITEARQNELQATLKLMRLQQQQQKESSKKQRQQEILSNHCRAAEDKLLSMKQRALSKHRLSEHHLQQVYDRDKENSTALLHTFEEEMMKQRNTRLHKERTTFREAQRELKMLAQKEAEEMQEREREINKVKLMRLAASCPYQEKILDLESDVLKTTKARQNDFYRRQNDLADFQRGTLRSFSDERCFSDNKYRLAHALHEAGINNTVAARDTVRSVIPRKEERTTGIRPY